MAYTVYIYIMIAALDRMQGACALLVKGVNRLFIGQERVCEGRSREAMNQRWGDGHTWGGEGGRAREARLESNDWQ